MKVEGYVITYLEHLSSIGFEIFFISNSSIKQEYRNQLTEEIKNCSIFEKENTDADFDVWKWAIDNNIIPDEIDYLLLTNDKSLWSFISLGLYCRDDAVKARC
jgi:lipopolysaccharide biosynthesis protein